MKSLKEFFQIDEVASFSEFANFHNIITKQGYENLHYTASKEKPRVHTYVYQHPDGHMLTVQHGAGKINWAHHASQGGVTKGEAPVSLQKHLHQFHMSLDEKKQKDAEKKKAAQHEKEEGTKEAYVHLAHMHGYVPHKSAQGTGDNSYMSHSAGHAIVIHHYKGQDFWVHKNGRKKSDIRSGFDSGSLQKHLESIHGKLEKKEPAKKK
jgi:hypothetical protein